MSTSFIVGLLDLGRPATVVGRIRTVIVDSVQRMLTRWTRAHIGKEQNKIAPTITGGDSSATVVFEALVFGITTAVKHACPDIIFGQEMSLSVFEVPSCSRFTLKASTGSRAARTKIVAQSGGWVSAIAKTIPRLVVGIVGERDQASKSLVGDVNKSWHETPIMAQT